VVAAAQWRSTNARMAAKAAADKVAPAPAAGGARRCPLLFYLWGVPLDLPLLWVPRCLTQMVAAVVVMAARWRLARMSLWRTRAKGGWVAAAAAGRPQSSAVRRRRPLR
jgi:uncharacterized membrane protein YeiB